MACRCQIKRGFLKAKIDSRTITFGEIDVRNIRPLVLQTNILIFQSMLVYYRPSHCVPIVICSVNWKYIFDKFGSFLSIIPKNILNSIYTPENIYLYLKRSAGKRRPTSWSACLNSDEVAEKNVFFAFLIKNNYFGV